MPCRGLLVSSEHTVCALDLTWWRCHRYALQRSSRLFGTLLYVLLRWGRTHLYPGVNAEDSSALTAPKTTRRMRWASSGTTGGKIKNWDIKKARNKKTNTSSSSSSSSAFHVCGRARSSARWLPGSPQSFVVGRRVPRAWWRGQWRGLSPCVVWRMCSGVCSSEPHWQWADSVRPSLFMCLLSPQCPVLLILKNNNNE